MLGMKARLKTQLIVLAVTVGAVAFVWWAGPTRLSANSLNWSDEKDLTGTTNTTEAHPHIQADGNTVYAVWTEQRTADGNSFDPFYAKSTNGGVSWISPNTVISPSVNTRSSNVAVAINEATGNPHFVWAEQEGLYDIYHQDVTETKKITQTGGTSLQPKIVVADNKVHVVWSEWLSGILYASKEVAETWPSNPAVEDISAGTADNYTVPNMAVGGDGKVHVVWSGLVGTDQFIYYNCKDGGWGTPTNLISPTHYTSGVFDYPAIAISGTHSIYVIYSNASVSDMQYIEFIKSTDGGQTWPFRKTITGPLAANNPTNSLVPDIAVDDEGIRAVWSGVKTGSSEDIFYGQSPNEGDSWTIEQVTDGTRNRRTPAMAVAQGIVHLIWVRGSTTLQGAYYSSGGQQGSGGDGGVYLPLILKNY
jgi:hypothetical protein